MAPNTDIAAWAQRELQGVNCADTRLNHRLGKLLTCLGQSPGASIPSACNGVHADIAAAYRFFDNASITPECILAPHMEQTGQRIAAQQTVLLVQDTTEIDMSQPQRRIRGAGPLDDSPRQGALLHLMHAFTAQGRSLGSVWHKIIVRPDRCAQQRPKSRALRASLPIEGKESWRWVQGIQAARALARQHPHTRHLCIADSEADIYECLSCFMQPEPGSQLHGIVRACQNRALAALEQSDPSAPSTLWEACEQAPVRWRKALQVRGRAAKYGCEKRTRRQPREDRDIEVEVRAVEQLQLRTPERKGHKLPAVHINAVLVREIEPPPGEAPVEWLLLTTAPVSQASEIAQVVEAYSQRFWIEVMFRTLKSGCGIENKRFHDAKRHLNHIALSLIIAWRVNNLSHLGREQPQSSAQEHFTRSEWQSAWAIIKGKEPPPEHIPTMEEMMKLVGKLGGWIDRGGKSASPPGVQTLWKGLQRLHDISLTWSILHP